MDWYGTGHGGVDVRDLPKVGGGCGRSRRQGGHGSRGESGGAEIGVSGRLCFWRVHYWNEPAAEMQGDYSVGDPFRQR